MRMSKFNFVAVMLASVLILNGCIIGYNRFPKNQLTAGYPEKIYGNATYFVKGMTIAGGNVAVQDTLRLHSPFQKIEESQEIPATGLHIHALVDTISPSVPAVIFGYLSYATLTLLPCWSTQDGVVIHFSIYKDKNLVKKL